MPQQVKEKESTRISIVDINVLLKERKELYEKALKFRAEKEKEEDGKKVLAQEDHSTFMRMLEDVNKMSDRADEMRVELQVQDSMAEATLRDRETDQNSPQAKYKKAWMQYVRQGMMDIEPEDRALLSTRRMEIQNALGVGSGAVGAYTVPEDFYARVVEVMKAFGGMRASGAEILRTASGADLPIPLGDDTANVGEIVSENSATLDNADPAFGQVVLKAYTYSSKILRVHLTLLQDTGVDLEVLLARWLATRIGRIQNTHFTTGDDSAQPDGVTHSAQNSGVTLASASAIAWDELVDIIHSVDPSYQMNGRFMFNDTTLAALKKMKEATTNKPLWLPAVSAREPDTVIGKPYTVNQDMPAFSTAGAKVIVFGDFSQYFIRDVIGGALARITERYIEYLQVGFLLYTRADGAVITPSAIKYALSHA